VILEVIINPAARHLDACVQLPLVFFTSGVPIHNLLVMIMHLAGHVYHTDQDGELQCVEIVFLDYVLYFMCCGSITGIFINLYIPFLVFERSSRLGSIDHSDILKAFSVSCILSGIATVIWGLFGHLVDMGFYCGPNALNWCFTQGAFGAAFMCFGLFVWFNGVKTYLQLIWKEDLDMKTIFQLEMARISMAAHTISNNARQSIRLDPTSMLQFQQRPTQSPTDDISEIEQPYITRQNTVRDKRIEQAMLLATATIRAKASQSSANLHRTAHSSHRESERNNVLENYEELCPEASRQTVATFDKKMFRGLFYVFGTGFLSSLSTMLREVSDSVIIVHFVTIVNYFWLLNSMASCYMFFQSPSLSKNFNALCWCGCGCKCYEKAPPPKPIPTPYLELWE